MSGARRTSWFGKITADVHRRLFAYTKPHVSRVKEVDRRTNGASGAYASPPHSFC